MAGMRQRPSGSCRRVRCGRHERAAALCVGHCLLAELPGHAAHGPATWPSRSGLPISGRGPMGWHASGLSPSSTNKRSCTWSCSGRHRRRASCGYRTQVKALAAKTDKLPELYALPSLPKATDPGPYTYDKSKHAVGNDVVSEPSTLPDRFRTLFADTRMHSMEKHLRRMKFGKSIKWRDTHVQSEDLRKEITELFDKFSKLDHELQTSKAQRHTPWDQRLEQLNAKIGEKELVHNHLLHQKHKLESELTSLRAEQNNVQKELQDLKERNQKVTNENLPRLEKIKVLLKETWSEVDRLTADAAMLSSMFRQQVEEYESAVKERDAVSSELSKVQKSLKRHKDEIMFKEDELQKKDTLYQRTVDARKDILESYQRQKDAIKDVEERQGEQNEVWYQLSSEAKQRDRVIRELREQINVANQKVDLLEQQKKLYMEEFKKKVGKPCGMLLEQFKNPERS
ncbi:unnamed protein product [Effrenium voratum]|nr:unnamed protein product [Effrenium voratum]